MGLFEIAKSWSWVNRALFPKPRASYDFKSFERELIFIPNLEGQERVRKGEPLTMETVVPCLFLEHSGAPSVIVVFHGNATDVGLIHDTMRVAGRKLNSHMLLMEYPGYGVSAGDPSERDILNAGRGVLKYLQNTMDVKSNQIILFGRSIGSGTAVQLAAECCRKKSRPAGLVTVSAFTSVCDLVGDLMGSIAPYLLAERFPSIKRIPEVTCPSLFVHGIEDKLIPYEHSQRLYKKSGCGARDKRLLEVELMDHNNCFDPALLDQITDEMKGLFKESMTGKALTLNWPQEVRTKPSLVA